MTKQDFEKKCKILASTPQNRWYDLRFKAFVNMLNNAQIERLLLDAIFPRAKMAGFFGFVFKFDNTYYFFIFNRHGNVYECFNVETIDFGRGNNIVASHIVLSSDDDADRASFLPYLMLLSGLNKEQLKNKLDLLFRNSVHINGNITL